MSERKELKISEGYTPIDRLCRNDAALHAYEKAFHTVTRDGDSKSPHPMDMFAAGMDFMAEEIGRLWDEKTKLLQSLSKATSFGVAILGDLGEMADWLSAEAEKQQWSHHRNEYKERAERLRGIAFKGVYIGVDSASGKDGSPT